MSANTECIEKMSPGAKAWLEGRIAASCGEKVGNNPYPEEDDLHFYWMDGWASHHTEEISARKADSSES